MNNLTAVQFKDMLQERGIDFMDVVLINPVAGVGIGITVSFVDECEAVRFHALTAGIGSTKPSKFITKRKNCIWKVVVGAPKRRVR